MAILPLLFKWVGRTFKLKRKERDKSLSFLSLLKTMRNIYLILSFSLVFFSINTIGQNLIDNNTGIINNYFNYKETKQENVVTKTQNIQYRSEVHIVQSGNYNNSYILSHTKNKQSVNQKGDNNNYEYYSYYNSNPSQVNMIQTGNNNDVQIFGQTELAKNISIIQNTNNKTLIIKNY
jgi:hypothetical protein